MQQKGITGVEQFSEHVEKLSRMRALQFCKHRDTSVWFPLSHHSLHDAPYIDQTVAQC